MEYEEKACNLMRWIILSHNFKALKPYFYWNKVKIIIGMKILSGFLICLEMFCVYTYKKNDFIVILWSGKKINTSMLFFHPWQGVHHRHAGVWEGEVPGICPSQVGPGSHHKWTC